MQPFRHAFARQAAPANPARLVLHTRFMLPDMTEHTCRATAITPDGALFLTPLEVAPGLAVVSYIEEIGRIEGETGERQPQGLAVAFRVIGPRRERMEARLALLATKQPPAGGPPRRHTRLVPNDPAARIVLPNGQLCPCEIIDISLSGAAIRIDVKPGLGTLVLLGRTRGRVVRHLEDGIAIEFVQQLDPLQFRAVIT